MSGSGTCEMCGGLMNDKFLFADQALMTYFNIK
jgi:hypothetical protein